MHNSSAFWFLNDGQCNGVFGEYICLFISFYFAVPRGPNEFDVYAELLVERGNVLKAFIVPLPVNFGEGAGD
jgi:hypothetical protein